MEEIVLLSKSFSDINRLKIIALINREKELCVCEISDTLHIAQPLVSRHLKQLKKSKILRSHQQGKWIIYSINPNPSDILKAYLNELGKHESSLGEIAACSKK